MEGLIRGLVSSTKHKVSVYINEISLILDLLLNNLSE